MARPIRLLHIASSSSSFSSSAHQYCIPPSSLPSPSLSPLPLFPHSPCRLPAAAGRGGRGVHHLHGGRLPAHLLRSLPRHRPLPALHLPGESRPCNCSCALALALRTVLHVAPGTLAGSLASHIACRLTSPRRLPHSPPCLPAGPVADGARDAGAALLLPHLRPLPHGRLRGRLHLPRGPAPVRPHRHALQEGLERAGAPPLRRLLPLRFLVLRARAAGAQAPPPLLPPRLRRLLLHVRPLLRRAARRHGRQRGGPAGRRRHPVARPSHRGAPTGARGSEGCGGRRRRRRSCCSGEGAEAARGGGSCGTSCSGSCGTAAGANAGCAAGSGSSCCAGSGTGSSGCCTGAGTGGGAAAGCCSSCCASSGTGGSGCCTGSGTGGGAAASCCRGCCSSSGAGGSTAAGSCRGSGCSCGRSGGTCSYTGSGCSACCRSCGAGAPLARCGAASPRALARHCLCSRWRSCGRGSWCCTWQRFQERCRRHRRYSRLRCSWRR